MMKKAKAAGGGLPLAGLGTAAIMLALVCAVCFAGCEIPASLPENGDADGMAAFSLRLGGGGARNAATPELYDHTVLLTGGPGPEEAHTVPRGTSSITLRVLPGTWTITVQARLDGALQYEGTAVRNIVRGGNNSISVTMQPAVPAQAAPAAQAPVIGSQPQDAAWHIDAEPGPLTVSATARNGGSLAYQWYRDDDATPGNGSDGEKAISGADGTLRSGVQGGDYVPDTGAQGTYYYYVVVTDPANGLSVTSRTAVVTVSAAACIVSFDSQGGSGVNAIGTTYGSAITRPAPDPARTGYAFGGWYTDAACTTAWDFAGDTVTADITLYAKWMPVYTVTFDGNANIFTNPYQIIQYEHGETLWTPSSPTRPGYIFDGWCREAVCITPWNFATDTVTGDITLYARWIYAGGAENDPVPVDNVTIANIGIHANYPLSGYYRLAVDITLNNWLAIGSDSACFTGSFDGNGKTITLAGTARLNGNYAGLFGAIDGGGKVRNVKIAGDLDVGTVSTSSIYAGAIAGVLKDGTIGNCVSETDVSVTNTGGEVRAGGIVGYVMNSYGLGKIKNCYATGTVSATASTDSYAGGIAGYSLEAIENCYAAGTVSASTTGTAVTDHSNAGGIAGYCKGELITYSVALWGSVTATGAGTMGTNYKAGGITASLYNPSSPSTNCYTTDLVTITSMTSGDDGGMSVTSAATQVDTWWRGIDFSFGDNADAPWKWISDNFPVLWFEEFEEAV